MDPKTGAIIEGDDAAIKKIEKDLGRELAPIPPDEVNEVRSMPMGERRAYAKKVLARRKRNKAAKAAKRKNRK